MTYVVDTNSFSVLKNYYPNSFPSLWQNLDQLANDGTLLSVREVLNELQNDNRVTFVQEWARRHRAIFATPTREELIAVQQILAIPHFQAVISEKALLWGNTCGGPLHRCQRPSERWRRRHRRGAPSECSEDTKHL
jgi:hypothetical protein